MRPIRNKTPKLPNLPNAVVILVFGILSISVCSFIGLVFGIVALSMAKKDQGLYMESPESFSKNSIGMVNAGRTCALIGTILSSIATLFMILYFIFLGAIFASMSGESGNFQGWF